MTLIMWFQCIFGDRHPFDSGGLKLALCDAARLTASLACEVSVKLNKQMGEDTANKMSEVN